MLLEFIEVGIFRPEKAEMLVPAECIEVCEYGVSFDMPRVADIDVQRIRVHRQHLLVHLISSLREIDAVAEGLAHLGLTISTRKPEACLVRRKDSLRFDEGFTVDPVEAAHDFHGLLYHRLLVLPYRHISRLESGDVRGLRDRIAEEPDREPASEGLLLTFGGESTHLDLCLHGRIPQEPGHGHEIHIIERKFRELRYLALDEQGHLVRIESDGEIVQSYLDDVLTDFFRIVEIIRKRLGISYEDKHLLIIAGILDGNPVTERPDIMAYVETTRRAVAGKYYLL